MRSSKYGLGLAITAACMAFGASSASAERVEVLPTDIGAAGSEWSAPADNNIDNGKFAFETGPSLTPLGTGSVQFSTPGSNDKANIATNRYAGQKLNTINAIGYSTHRDPGSTGVAVPALNITGDMDGAAGGLGFTTLVYEPYLANGNGAIQNNVWQDWDAFQTGTQDGGWWATGAGGTQTGCQPTPAGTCTLAEIQGLLPNMAIAAVAINQGRGGDNTGLTSNADALYVSQNNTATTPGQVTYDFESEAGPTGPQGNAGTNGTNGATGATGQSGAQGPQGLQGAQGTQGLTPSSTTTTGRVSLVSKSLKAGKNRKVSVSITCPRANGLCEGRLSLLVKGKTIARSAFEVKGGRSGKVTVTLSKKAYKALKKSQSAKVNVFSRDNAGNASSASKSLTLKK
jgi:hypothetical protein